MREKGICAICGKETLCYTSTDLNHETGYICTSCIKTEGYIPCALCHDMRAPENLCIHSITRKHYCIGCIEAID